MPVPPNLPGCQWHEVQHIQLRTIYTWSRQWTTVTGSCVHYTTLPVIILERALSIYKGGAPWSSPLCHTGSSLTCLVFTTPVDGITLSWAWSDGLGVRSPLQACLSISTARSSEKTRTEHSRVPAPWSSTSGHTRIAWEVRRIHGGATSLWERGLTDHDGEIDTPPRTVRQAHETLRNARAQKSGGVNKVLPFWLQHSAAGLRTTKTNDHKHEDAARGLLHCHTHAAIVHSGSG